jgi:hypothetical protein
MVIALATGKMADANEAFSQIMSAKTNEALDERKVAVASQVYSPKQEQN